MLPKWQKHLPHKLHSQPHLPMETTSYAKHGELFASKILVCVQPLITRLCPLHVHKHRFIVHNPFITMNRWSAVHYDISLQRTSLQRCKPLYVPVKSKLKHPPPGIWMFVQIPPPEAKKQSKCPIISPFQLFKCLHPWETFQYLLLCSGSCVCKHGLIDNTLTCQK